jgi:hypothetical protein
MLTTEEGIERFTEDLVAAARRRYDKDKDVLAPMSIDYLEQVVRELGKLAVRLRKQGIDMGHVAMSMDYYSRAVADVVDKTSTLANQKTVGDA